MGAVNSIRFDAFPRQGDAVGCRVTVFFHYDTSRGIEGVVVRDDMERPFETIIKLDDGRYVRGAECQHSLPFPRSAKP